MRAEGPEERSGLVAGPESLGQSQNLHTATLSMKDRLESSTEQPSKSGKYVEMFERHEREEEKVWIWAGREVGRSSEELEEGKPIRNQNIFYKIIYFQFKNGGKM